MLAGEAIYCWPGEFRLQVTTGMGHVGCRASHLVAIHPFPNGNGRHARLVADLIVERLGKPRFTWGRHNLVDASETRQQYIAALQAADRRDISPLLAFARS